MQRKETLDQQENSQPSDPLSAASKDVIHHIAKFCEGKAFFVMRNINKHFRKLVSGSSYKVAINLPDGIHGRDVKATPTDAPVTIVGTYAQARKFFEKHGGDLSRLSKINRYCIKYEKDDDDEEVSDLGDGIGACGNILNTSFALTCGGAIALMLLDNFIEALAGRCYSEAHIKNLGTVCFLIGCCSCTSDAIVEFPVYGFFVSKREQYLDRIHQDLGDALKGNATIHLNDSENYKPPRLTMTE